MQSDWFGTFHHYPKNGFIIHDWVGFTYLTLQNKVFGFGHLNTTGYGLKKAFTLTFTKIPQVHGFTFSNQQTQGKDFYDYQSGLFK